MSLAVTGALSEGARVGLRCEQGTIVELGPGVEARAGDEVIDAGAAGLALVPGLVNAHGHAAMTLFRGYADDLGLMDWLENHIWPAEAGLDSEDVYWGARLACAEMIRTGTVCFWDMYWHPEATARAAIDSGLRAVIGAPLIDRAGAGAAGRLRRDAVESVEALSGIDPRITPALAPHAIYTVSEPSLEWIAELAAERDLAVQIHLSETEGEVSDCLAEHGVRPAQLLDRVGLLGPRAVLSHAVWLDDAERDLIAGHGATLVTNPIANLKLAVGGIFDYRAARHRGIGVGIGTDGAGSNNGLDLFADTKLFALLQKHLAGDAAAIDAAEALAVARGMRAPVLGAQTLRVGSPADFLLVRARSPELALGSFDAGMAYAASGSIVDTTVVAGRALMRGGIVAELDEVVGRARERAARLGLRHKMTDSQ